MIIKAIVANKMRTEKKCFDFIDHFSKYNFLKLITSNIGTNNINGIVNNSNTALSKLLIICS